MKAETTVTRVEELLAESSSVPDLATRLGRACLDDAERLKRIRSGQKAREWLDFIEKWTRSVGMEEWVEFVEDPTRFRDCLGPDFCQVLSQAQTRHPLDCYGVLKGLCTGALFQLYDVRTDEIHELVGPIPLRRGTPMPYLQRKPKRASEGVVTPWRQTVREGSNGLEIKAFDFFKLEPEPSLEITLDYRSSAELELADNAGEGFPLIATIHPPESGNVHIEWRNGTHFFGVRPSVWDPDRIGENLELAKDAGAQIALLPELSLPAPGSLATQIAANHDRYPLLIVAGSAHVEYRGSAGSLVRANESHIYLGGECVMVARKIHPFMIRSKGRKIKEAITGEPKCITALCGTKTRLVVAICADMNETELPSLLAEAGVNFLLVPSMTEKFGAFNGPVASIASQCQGVAVVANVRFRPDGEPFLMMGATPFSKPEEQTGSSCGERGGALSEVAIFNPNLPFGEAIDWIR